jgi:pimeloyl-ACP methyl ester carboxylesterase/DNA-binding SARP family transcriptional activator
VRVAISLLGPFGVTCDGRDVTPSSLKAQALLATLAARDGAPVAADILVDELWPDLPPDRGRRVLHVRVAEIRKQFADAGAPLELAVESSVAGYRLAAPAGALDSAQFVGLVQRAEDRAKHHDVATASTLLREALGLWHGEALSGIQVSHWLETAAAELDELRLAAVEERVAAELAEGCHQRLVGELEALVAAHPLRERLWEQLVIALYRSGRQTEALRACASVRRQLTEDIGVAPGPRLRELEAAVLAHDPALDLPAIPPTGAVVAFSVVADPRRRGGAPPVRYVRADDGVDIAYQVAGDGPDLLFVPGFPSHLDVWWEPWGGGLIPALAEFCRVIIFDKRGMGLSDRPPNVGIEPWLEDVELIRRAAGAERPIVFGMSSGGPVAIRYASRHADGIAGVVLYGARAKYVRSDDYPYGVEGDELDAALDHLERIWGNGDFFDQMAPSAAADPWLRREFARYERLAASPASGIAYLRAVLAMDVRGELADVDVPTLVVHATGDRIDPVEQARDMAARLPRAVMVELDSCDHLIWLSDARDQLIDAIRSFVVDLPVARPRASA